ncbi:hypothetical protein [Priestia megaterium]|uniref:hypothetical protein n=1 Tax=Priestia megaterium TaxID=1404 RepID=UPI0013646712|nr:hypothetical protein [Priestia megaterium]
MEIQIGRNYKITSDALNVILNKRYEKKDSEGNVVEHAYKPIGFYPNLTSACIGLLTKQVNQSEAESLEGLKDYIAAVERNIVKAVGE